MEDIFIQKIVVDEVRSIKNFEILLDENIKKHLIITGKNGSGKTSLLNSIRRYLNSVIDEGYYYSNALKSYKKELLELESVGDSNKSKLLHIKDLKNKIFQMGDIKIDFSKNELIKYNYRFGEFVIAFFDAKRDITFEVPTGIQKINSQTFYKIKDKPGQKFIQHIVNLKADRSFANDENDIGDAEKIDEWFLFFEKSLSNILGSKGIIFEFDRKTYNFNIVEPNKEPYNLNQLSDGFAAILNIVTELIMRMEEHKNKSYDVQGIVLIDEIETHLHIDLQKKVFPFLTTFFPKIQFIVTTHSPFVLNSVDNAVICDLEKKIVTSDLSGYSYDTLVESYFNSDKYSDLLKSNISEYEDLMSKSMLLDEEKDRLFELKQYLAEIPKFLSDELAVKMQQIRLKNYKKAV